MHLLKARTQELEEIPNKPPAYAILTHRWRDREVQFNDIKNLDDAGTMPGYYKIKHCCDQALQDGLEYVWIDTCCIDKQSSAVLSESLNSMFTWYKAAHVCYAYLDDVCGDEDPNEDGSSFEDSEWWGRGWTLQELLAPETVYFFAKDWTMIGSKISLAPTIAKITGIHTDTLLYPERLPLFSVATRMSWAARRRTTKEEDMAYALMGIFDVHMPIIYGEGGKRAFSRLQHEIIRTSNDQSIFAWRTHTPARRPSTPLTPLAESPAFFSRCGDIQRISPGDWAHYCAETNQAHLQATAPRLLEFAMTNNGLNITLPIRELKVPEDTFEAILCCCTGPVAWDGSSYAIDRAKAKVVCIYLRKPVLPYIQHYERVLDLDGEKIKPNSGYTLQGIHLGSPQPSLSQKDILPNFAVHYVGVSDSKFTPRLHPAPSCVFAKHEDGAVLLRMERPLELGERLTLARIVVQRPKDGECFTVVLGASSTKSDGGPWVYATQGNLDETEDAKAVQSRSKMDWAKLTLRTREVVNLTMRKMDSSVHGGKEYKVTLMVHGPTPTNWSNTTSREECARPVLTKYMSDLQGIVF